MCILTHCMEAVAAAVVCVYHLVARLVPVVDAANIEPSPRTKKDDG